jgi:hypothetical protein
VVAPTGRSVATRSRSADPVMVARDKIAREIRKHAKDKAREILHWYR